MTGPGAGRRDGIDAPSFEVVFVCTANRARSPTAQALLAAQGVPGVRARSAGLLDLGPLPAMAPAVRAAAHFGIDISGHRARSLEQGELANSDLVIGFEPAHMSGAIVDGQARLERTFAIAELAGILSKLEPTLTPTLGRAGLRELAHASRPVGFLSTPVVQDPLGKGDEVFLEVVDELARLVQIVVRILLRRPDAGGGAA